MSLRCAQVISVNTQAWETGFPEPGTTYEEMEASKLPKRQALLRELLQQDAKKFALEQARAAPGPLPPSAARVVHRGHVCTHALAGASLGFGSPLQPALSVMTSVCMTPYAENPTQTLI